MRSDTLLNWLDMKDNRAYISTIKELYEHYAHSEITLRDKSYSIPLFIDHPDSTLVKFQDIIGWTDGIMICKRVAENWCEITANDQMIVVSDTEFIPVYFPDRPVDGFHGEIKYSYILKHAGKVTEDDYVRLICNNESMFVHPKISKENELVMWSYEIITKSRFINAGIFHIFGNNEVTVDEAKTWEDSEDGRPRISNKCIK